MLRRSIALLLILTFLPVPGPYLLFGSYSPFFRNDAAVGSFVPASPHSVARHETDADGVMPHGEDIIFESESEIAESEASANGDTESVDFACVFERQLVSNGRSRIYDCLIYRGSNRFSNPNEVFRILRC